jgi:hypothetical protein
MPNQLDPETARLLALIQMQRAMGSEQPPVARPPVEQPPVSQPPFDPRAYILANPDQFPMGNYPYPRDPYPAKSKNPLLAALEIMVRPSGGYPMYTDGVRPSGGYPTIETNVRPSGGYSMPATNVRPSGGYPMPMVRPSGGYPTTQAPAYYPSSRT